MPTFDVNIRVSNEFNVTETVDAADHDAAAAQIRSRVSDGVFRYAQPSGRDDGSTIVLFYPAANLILQIVEAAPTEDNAAPTDDAPTDDATPAEPPTDAAPAEPTD